MLLILQGVHESKGVTDDYLRLEALIQKVVSPYLGTHGLYSRDGSSNLHCSSCVLEKRLQRSWSSKQGNSPIAKNLVVRSQSYNIPMLTPVGEYDTDSSAGGGTGIRRHSVSEMTSCLEESSSLAESTTTATSNTSRSSLANHSPASTASAALSGPHPLQPQNHSPCILPQPSPGEDTHCAGSLVSDSPASSRALAQDTSSGPSPSSSLEIMTDHVPESLDSEPELDGIFLDFSRRQIHTDAETCANSAEP